MEKHITATFAFKDILHVTKQMSIKKVAFPANTLFI
jgi:hypothetical protein